MAGLLTLPSGAIDAYSLPKGISQSRLKSIMPDFGMVAPSTWKKAAKWNIFSNVVDEVVTSFEQAATLKRDRALTRLDDERLRAANKADYQDKAKFDAGLAAGTTASKREYDASVLKEQRTYSAGLLKEERASAKDVAAAKHLNAVELKKLDSVIRKEVDPDNPLAPFTKTNQKKLLKWEKELEGYDEKLINEGWADGMSDKDIDELNEPSIVRALITNRNRVLKLGQKLWETKYPPGEEQAGEGQASVTIDRGKTPMLTPGGDLDSSAGILNTGDSTGGPVYDNAASPQGVLASYDGPASQRLIELMRSYDNVSAAIADGSKNPQLPGYLRALERLISAEKKVVNQ